MAAKFGAYGKICSISFVTSTTDVLEPCAALTLHSQFATVFHLPAYLNAFQLSPSTHIIIVVFFDGQAMSPECHEPEPQEIS
jgi:cytochrome c oxidase assembly factor CtaG